jgi:uncharacterized protein
VNLGRRKLLKSCGGLTLGGLFGAAYMRCLEPYWLETTSKDLVIPSINASIRALHLSDFHVSEVMSLDAVERAIDLGLAQNPDIIFLTGDYITWKISDEPKYVRLLKKLADASPTFACLGNHDGGLWAGSSHGYRDSTSVEKMLELAGVRILVNEAETILIKGQMLRMVGLGDIWSGLANPRAVLKQKRTEEDETVIVLSHNPDSKELLKSYDWDLTLCGHTHGGQVVVPFLGLRPFLPVRDKSFPEGVLTWEKRHIHITRGVGNLHGMRFNCRPEISILNLI